MPAGGSAFERWPTFPEGAPLEVKMTMERITVQSSIFRIGLVMAKLCVVLARFPAQFCIGIGCMKRGRRSFVVLSVLRSDWWFGPGGFLRCARVQSA